MRGAAKDRPPRAPQRLCQLPTDRQKHTDFVIKLSKAVSRFASPTGWKVSKSDSVGLLKLVYYLSSLLITTYIRKVI